MRIRTLLLLAAMMFLLMCGCNRWGIARDTPAQLALFYGDIFVGPGRNWLSGVEITQLTPPAKELYLSCTVLKRGVFYRFLPAGSYKLSAIYTSTNIPIILLGIYIPVSSKIYLSGKEIEFTVNKSGLIYFGNYQVKLFDGTNSLAKLEKGSIDAGGEGPDAYVLKSLIDEAEEGSYWEKQLLKRQAEFDDEILRNTMVPGVPDNLK